MPTDRNLLFGLIALEKEHLTRDQLAEGLTAWLARRREPLALVLQQRGALLPEQVRAVEALLPPGAPDTDDSRGSLPSTTDDPPGGGPLAAPSGTPAPSRYRRLRSHARGGLGEVYVARDEELGRDVALKEIQPHYADSPVARRRFVREAEVTGNLEHPGVVPVYGLGSYPDGQPYYAMRFIQGETLHEAIQRFHGEGQPVAARAGVLRALLGRFVAVCNAVAYAHSRGVVHRDLKPANVMLGEYGETLVVDWGLARVVGQGEGNEETGIQPASAEAATQQGRAVGTPAFMAAEQARGEQDKVGPLSDVFALGATLYCLLTGQAPYRGPDALRQAERGEPPAARQINSGVPVALEAVCAKAMAARPEDRYASAKELAQEVDRWLADEPVTAMPQPWRDQARRWAKRHRTLVASGGVLLLASVAGLGLGLWAVEVQRRQTVEAKGEADRNLVLANERLDPALKAEAEAKENLKQSEANLKLAKDAVDGCYRLVTENRLFKGPTLSKEAHDLKRLLLVQALPFYQRLRQQRPGAAAARDVGEQHSRVGLIQDELGRKTEALASYRQAEAEARALVKAQPGAAENQGNLSRTLVSLGNVQNALGQPTEAHRSHTEAIGLYRALVKAQPDVPAYQSDLANALNSRGTVHWGLGQPTEALRSYTEAIGLYRALVKAHPGVPAYWLDSTRPLGSQAMLLRELRRPEEARRALDESLTTLAGLQQRLPGYPGLTLIRFLAHWERARALVEVGKYRDALHDWDQALVLAPVRYRTAVRLGRADSLARAGQHDRATAEAAAVVRQPKLAVFIAYDAACVLSLSAAGMSRDAMRPLPLRERLAEARARQAVTLLSRAAELGYFRQPGTIAHLGRDRDLDFLRGRADFTAFVAGLPKQ